MQQITCIYPLQRRPIRPRMDQSSRLGIRRPYSKSQYESGRSCNPDSCPRRGPDSFGLLSVMDRTYCQPRSRTRMASGFVRTSSTIIFSRSGKSRPALDQRARMRLRAALPLRRRRRGLSRHAQVHTVDCCAMQGLGIEAAEREPRQVGARQRIRHLPHFCPTTRKKHRAFPLSA